jgi:hypothetical protein
MSQLIRNVTLAAAIACICHSQASAAVPAGSAYKTDTQFSHVEDATSKGIGQVNMIACILSALKPDGVVNKGPYLALVDETKCDPESRSSSSNAGSDSSAQSSSFTTVTVDSTRVSNSDPMIVKAWLDENDDGHASTSWVHGSFTEPPTDANPYGLFRLDFCGSAGDSTCMMRGFVNGTDGALNFYSDESRDGGSNNVALHLTSVGSTTGSGKMSITQSEGNQSVEQHFLFAYDDAHFLRGDQCFTRDASDPETGMSVWSYGLYNASTGARIDRNSGFPIEYATGGVTYHGFLGYWGLSLPSDVLDAMPSGSTVQKVDYNQGQEPTRTNYTVVRAAGRLMKYTKHERTLHGIDKIRFNTWVGDASSFFSGATSNTQYTMYWDEANATIKVVGMMNCSENGCQSQDLDSEHAVALTFWQNMGGIQGWSEALGGELFVDLHALASPVDSDALHVVYRTQDTVYPADMPAQLYCVNNCPTASSMSTYFSSQSNDPQSSPFVSSTFNNWQPSNTPVSYTMDSSTALLMDDQSQAVTLTDRSAAQAHPQYGNGLRSGRLFTNLAAAECAPNSGTYCDSKVNTLDVYYTWETGPNSYNQFAAVKDAQGNYVSLDAPLQVTFDVPNDATLYKDYAGKSIVLQYGGFGQLWGIPGHCVSHLTNQPVSCDQQESRYVPEFVIPYDETVGVVHEGDNTYLVKWLDREIRFARKQLSECSALTLPANTTLPTAADLKNPADPQSDIYNGTRPVVTDAPRVVHGEVKF